MRPQEFPITLNSRGSAPVFVQIAQALAEDIARGRLRAGNPLPGARTLALHLGVHRTTVMAAYAELTAQGWIETKRAQGTYVAASVPALGPRQSSKVVAERKSQALDIGYSLEPLGFANSQLPQVPRGAIALWGGVPDPRLVPVELLTRAYRRVAKRQGTTLFGYTNHVNGHPDLRIALATLAATARAIACDANSVFVTRGSQMAIDLLTRSLIRPSDVVVVEALSYPSAVNVFRRAGADVVAVPVDAQGMNVDAVIELSRKRRVRLIYVTPHHQYPTTVTLAASRRLALLEHARRERIAIVEDDYDQEFHYDGRPVLPLASHEPTGNVIYIGTLAKILAPGLRLAFVIAPPALSKRLADERLLVDRQGDGVLECAIAELLEEGDLQRHANRSRRIYHARRDAFCAALDKELGGVLSYKKPPGGLAIWAKVSSSVNLDAWHKRSNERGVYFQIGRQFTLDGSPVPYVRLGFALVSEAEGASALHQMAQSLPARSKWLPR